MQWTVVASFRKYVMVWGGWACTIFVTNFYGKFRRQRYELVLLVSTKNLLQ